MNIPTLNYLMLSSIREYALQAPHKASSLFGLPVPVVLQLRDMADSDLRRACESVTTPLVQAAIDPEWLTAVSRGAANTINFDDLVRYRAAVLGKPQHA